MSFTSPSSGRSDAVAAGWGWSSIDSYSNDPHRFLRCRATVGEIGNAVQSNINWGKAGRMRWEGKRPSVRGVAMNPIDHPHGGGEGKTSGGRHPVNPKGKPEGRTRRANLPSDRLIVRRRYATRKRG